MEDENAGMAAVQAQFEETITKLREELTTRLRVEEAANKTMRKEAKKGRKGRWAHPSTSKVVVIQLIVEEPLFRLWVPCGHVGRVPVVVWVKVCRMFLGILYQTCPWNALLTNTSLGSDVLRFL